VKTSLVPKIRKADLALLASSILHSSTQDEPLAGDRADFIQSLLMHHCDWEDDAVGMTHLTVKDWEHHGPGSRGFVICRGNGSWSTLSYKQALAGVGIPREEQRRKAHIRYVVRTARAYIEPQTAEFRQRTPQQLAGMMEVDHVYPLTFLRLLFDYLKGLGLNIHDVGIDDDGCLSGVSKFTDAKIGEGWIEYHREHAVLQYLTPAENSRAKKFSPDWEGGRASHRGGVEQ